ncbi:MAG: hypothetical protein IKQ17_08400 [Kiritimatiellae bacterium]|nr:hypothetical protein [Kiritimatiellia bacterium]
MTRIAKRNGVGVMFPDQASADIAKAIVREVKEQGLAKAQAKLDTRSKLFNLLFKTALGTGVTYDEAGFKEGLAKVSNGRQFIDKHGNIYGFVDGEGGVHFNPVALNFNTPIHEYGHLALEAIKGFNNKLWQRGMDLVKESDYYREIARQSEIEGHEYSYLKGKVDQICDEALATMIGDRGEKLVTEKGLEAPLKAWLKEFWKAFKGAFGLADLSDEQVERMTLAEFADAVNAELLRGSEFGIRRRPSGLNRREAAKLREKKKEDQHYAEEAAREEAEERERFEKSGMSVIDYVRSRAEEGEPPFDIDWEIARELAHEEAEGRFAARRLIDGRETAVSEGYPLSIREARDPDKVLKVLSPLVGKSAAQIGEMKLTRINAESMEHTLNSKEARHDLKDSSRKGKRLWRGRIGGLSVLDDIIATSPLGNAEKPNHFNRDWKKDAKFYRAETRFAVETEQGYEIYPCKLLVAELKNGERFVYDLVEVKEPTLSASAGKANLALPQGRTGESASSSRIVPNSGAGAQGGERSFNGVTPEQDAAYAEAVKRGDLETARRMEREVYERMGYSDDSSYQGTSAFNGAAPSRNAYFETKAERIEAAKNGEMEDTTTLGDYRDGIDVNNLQFIVFDPRSERNADAKRQEAIRNIRGVLDSGAKTITMYRSVPADVKETQFRNGDWITPSRAYAEENAQIHGWGDKFRIIEQEVSVEDVWWDGNDIAEWGFDDGRGSVYKNTAANRKLLGPTYDDAGNLIPLSKRFNDWKNDARFAVGKGREDWSWLDESIYMDENRIAVSKLEDATLLQFKPQAVRGDFKGIIAQTGAEAQGGAAKLAAGREDWSWLDESIFQVKPSLATVAMGEREQKPAGLAAAVEKREALRPWTKKQSPADLAKPIAFDAADMVMFWRAVSGSLRNPHVQKGERIKGRPSAIGLNVGGDRIEIVSKLFGVIDASDIKTLREACKADGFFQNEDPDWAAKRSKASVQAEIDRSNAELDKRTRELFRKRVETGEGGEHYATEVLGHEIGHTLGLLPAGAQLGPVGNAAMTLYKAMEREWKRQISETRKVGDAAKNVKGEITRLIAWWHGQEKMPDYYRKPNEMFAELFGIFLTQPESVQAAAPHAYDACVKIIAGNDKLAAAYRKIAGLKWSGKSNDRVMDEVRKTWEKEAQDQYRKLRQMSRESVSLKRDWFSYALNDRFGPMFNIARRGLAAEKKLLEEAVRTGAMSEAEAKDRLAEKEAEINALKTSLYDWQRQSGGQTRLMIAEFDEVRDAAERDGTSWNDVRDYAHLMRVIELGGRATAHGMDPARASATLEDMQKRMGAAAFANVEKTWKAFRAVYERSVLEDANVREIFDDATMKLLYENKHYVTMKHRMSVEESAEWQRRIEEYRRGNKDAWDPCIDIQERLHRGFGSGGDGERGFVLHRLEGSFEATEDPLAATIRRAIEIKESAARNHLLKQMSETLRTLGAKGVYDTAIEKGAKPRTVDGAVYGKLAYMEGGVRHELIVPKVVYKSFKTENTSFGAFGAAMRFIRNTMTLWNPMFINRAYLVDKSALETNLKGMHKAPIDVLSEAFCIRGIGVPLYLANNYLTRFTPIANTWVGKLLWNENTANHYAHQAQKIARICYEGKFGERLSEARELREMGETGKAAEIEQNVAIAKEMLRRNVFQSAYEFNREQAGFDTDAIMQQFGYRIDGGKDPATWRGRAWAKTKAAGRWWNRFEEEQEAVTKIIAYLYEMKKGGNADAVARTVIEQGGTPNLAARGVFASYIENATGFFWNVRKEGMLRTVRALKDHPTEWICKNLAQTALPALLKGLMVTGGLEVLIRSLFDDDDEKVKRSWWAPAVIEHARFMNAAMKCVPGYYQRNYNIIPLAKFGDHVLSMRVKYSPEEFAAQNAIHTAFQMFGKDPTDPDADWSTLASGMWSEFLPDIFGRNYALDAVGTIVGPLLGVNPYDRYRQRNIYDDATWKTRWDKPGHMMQEIGKNFWNYSPLGTFTATFKNGQERRLEDTDVPAWLDRVLATPVVSRIPASMLTITSSDTYVKALGRVDQKRRAYAKLIAQDILADCIANGRLGGFDDALKDLPPELRVITIRHVINGWRQYHMDPAAKTLKRMRAIKDPHLKARARQWIEDGMKDD